VNNKSDYESEENNDKFKRNLLIFVGATNVFSERCGAK
jgi:hypothetical protein